MRKITLLFLLFTAIVHAQYTTATYGIPSAGGVLSLYPNNPFNPTPQMTTLINLNTGGNATTLSGGYTLQYTGLPPLGTAWSVYCDFSKLNAAGQQVNVFGVAPLDSFPGTTRFYIDFWVDSAVLYHQFKASLGDLSVINNRTIFTGAAYFGDTLKSTASTLLYSNIQFQPTGFSSTNDANGNPLISTNDSGVVIYGPCGVWYQCGNTGNPFPSYVGNADTAALRFGVGGLPAGILDGNLENTGLGVYSLRRNSGGGLNTAIGVNAMQGANTGSYNTAIGAAALYANTSGLDNTAVGASSLTATTTGYSNVAMGENSAIANTTGYYNVAIGVSSLGANTTGNTNTAIGTESLFATTTGTNNVGVGPNSLLTLTTGSYNTAIGSTADVASGSTSYSVAVGANAIGYPSCLSIFPRAEYLHIPLNPLSHIGNALTDTSGGGDYISVPPVSTGPYYTPTTGSTITIASSPSDEVMITVNPASGISALTFNLPAGRANQILRFEFNQTVTTITWTPASGSVTALPTTAGSQYLVIAMYWDTNTSAWYRAGN